MDPLSPPAVANIPVNIAKAAWSCSQGIYSFVDGNLLINKDLDLEHNEAISLHNNAKGLDGMLWRTSKMRNFWTMPIKHLIGAKSLWMSFKRNYRG